MINETELGILKILVKENQITMNSLAERLKLNKKTIERNIIKLMDNGAPIIIKRGRAGGVSLGGDSAFHKVLLNKEEVISLCVAIKIHDSLYKSNLKAEVVSKIGKLNPYYVCLLNTLDDILEIDLVDEKSNLYDQRGIIRKLIMDRITFAIKKSKMLKLSFRNISESIDVIPDKIILRKDASYLRYYHEDNECTSRIDDLMDVKVVNK